ncbi:MAG: NAD(P)/FAD-dependent oxidoreductase [Microbacterium sp.]
MARRATVVGSGPNGLAGAAALARAGFDVRVIEAYETIGGGTRTAELTLPGFRHDVCSAVHPGALDSPIFRALGLRESVEWIIPEISYAHPLDDGRAGIAWHDIERTADGLGADSDAWRDVLGPLVRRYNGVADFTGNQMLRVPHDPVAAIRFGLRSLRVGTGRSRGVFATDEARGLLTGVLAHANTRLPSLAAAGAGLLLATQAHNSGWPLPRGGAQSVADALAADILAHGGSIETGTHVHDLADLDWGDPAAGDVLLLDTAPRLALSHPDAPISWARKVYEYRYGPAASKVDFALDGPVPWANADVARAVTVHLGGTRGAIENAENTVARGGIPANPFVLVTQPSVADDSRAPAGRHTLWAYMHVPNGSDFDATEAITRQVERYAPGFRDIILASHASTARDLATYNPSAIGGDFAGGAVTMPQLLGRPVMSSAPWRTPMRGIYLASAATPPGPGVNGMAGWYAARLAIRDATGERVELADLPA